MRVQASEKPTGFWVGGYRTTLPREGRTDALAIVNRMRSTSVCKPGQKGFVFLDQAGREPMAFASEIEKDMSSQQIVMTSCPATAKMEFDLEYLTQ